jgi:hypothetical protein
MPTPDEAAARFRAAVATRAIKMLAPEPTEAELERAYRHFDPEAHRQQVARLEESRRRDALTLAAREQLERPVVECRLPPAVAAAVLWIGAVAGFLASQHIG